MQNPGMASILQMEVEPLSFSIPILETAILVQAIARVEVN